MRICVFQSMTHQLVLLIRDAVIRETVLRHRVDQSTHNELPGCCSDAPQRGNEALLGVTSQLAWQKDASVAPRHHDDDRPIGSGQGQVSGSRLFPVRRNRVLPLNSDVVDDAGAPARGRHRRRRKKRRRHRYEQTLVDNATPTSGHQTT